MRRSIGTVPPNPRRHVCWVSRHWQLHLQQCGGRPTGIRIWGRQACGGHCGGAARRRSLLAGAPGVQPGWQRSATAPWRALEGPAGGFSCCAAGLAVARCEAAHQPIHMLRSSVVALAQGVENVDTAVYHGMVLPGGEAMEILRVGEWRHLHAACSQLHCSGCIMHVRLMQAWERIPACARHAPVQTAARRLFMR